MPTVGVTGTNGKTSCSQWLATASDGGRQAVRDRRHAGHRDAGQARRERLHDARCAAAPAQSRAIKGGGRAGRGDGSVVAWRCIRARERHAFDIAIFTNLTQDHLDYHGTFDAYEAAKARLFAWPALKAAIVNRDDAAGQRLIEALRGKLRTIAYGVEIPVEAVPRADALLLATNVRATANGTAFHLASDWGDAEVEVGTLGAFNVSNLLAVLGALLETGVPLDAALAQIAKLEPVNGRMQRLGGRLQSDEPLVVIDYAHTPDALDKTLAALRPIAEARGGSARLHVRLRRRPRRDQAPADGRNRGEARGPGRHHE